MIAQQAPLGTFPIIQSSLIGRGMFYFDNMRGCFYTNPDDIYSIAFMSGVTDHNLDFACKVAKRRVHEFIDNLLKELLNE